MRDAEHTSQDTVSQQKPGWSPPHWLLKLLAKSWWLIGFECLTVLGVILVYPLAQGFDGWGQNIQTGC